MEPTNPVSASAKMESSDSEKDFISELPDPLLHHILSFLDMELVVQTSGLAKRWRYVWRSLNILSFNEEGYHCRGLALGVTPRSEGFMNFVDKVLLLHNSDHMEEFKLCCSSCNVKLDHLDPYDFGEFLYQLTVGSRKMFQLPQPVVTCKSLTTLILDMGTKVQPYFKVPLSVDLPALKYLYLNKLCLVNGESFGEFISNCPVLDTLIIQACAVTEPKMFTISARQLKALALQAFCLESFWQHITLSTPSLKSFFWRDSSDYLLVDSSSLNRADIGLSSHFDVRTPSGIYNIWSENGAKTSIIHLKELSNVEHLTICDLSIELAMKASSELQNTVTPFCYLKVLKMNICHSAYSIPTVNFLLEKCPSIESLTMVIYKFESCSCYDETKAGFEDGDECSMEAEQQVQRTTTYQLKFVRIQDIRGNVYELELLKFLLKNANVLEKLTVVPSKKLTLDNALCCNFKEKLVAFPSRASSSADILFCSY